MRVVNDITKESTFVGVDFSQLSVAFGAFGEPAFSPVVYSGIQKAKNAYRYIYTKENFVSPPDLYVCAPGYQIGQDTNVKQPPHGAYMKQWVKYWREEKQLSSI